MSECLPGVAVTGVTGAVGGMVAARLADAGVPQRLLARDVDAVPELADAVALRFDYDDPDTTRRGLVGVDTVFMVSAHESAQRRRQHRDFIDAAVAAGVSHLVYTSFVGAAADAVFTLARDHHDTEQHLRDSGLTYTLLRDNFYLDMLPTMVGDDGIIRGPAGEGRAAFVARRDVAAVAAEVLRRPDAHRDRTYLLTGPQALTMAEVAATLSRHTGDHVTFRDETIAEARRSRRAWNPPDWQLDAWISTYTAIAAGELAEVSADVETITGRPATSLAGFLADGAQ